MSLLDCMIRRYSAVLRLVILVLFGASPLVAQEISAEPRSGLQISSLLAYQLPNGALGYGMQLEVANRSSLIPLLQLTRWGFDGGCANLSGPCYTSGWSAEVGLHYPFRSPGDLLQPYVGLAGGRIELEEQDAGRAHQRWMYSVQGGLDLRLTPRIALRIDTRLSVPRDLPRHPVRYTAGSAGLRIRTF